MRRSACLLAAALGLAQAGCAVVSPDPAWELAKATASAVSLAIASTPPHSNSTIRHFEGSLGPLCIAYEPRVQMPDVVPALQAELRGHGIDSRVYDGPMPAGRCPAWLHYSAVIDWDRPPFRSHYQPFVRQAALSLRAADGLLLSSSQYDLDALWGQGKWASTREKLAPVVAALLTGTEQPPDGQVPPAHPVPR